MKESIGFVGLGYMGSAIARALMKAGYPLTVYDRRPEAIEELVGMGATPAESLAAVSSGVDVIALCVLDDTQVLEVTLGPGGIVESAREGSMLIVHSTARPATIHRVDEACRERGIRVLDAPVAATNPRSLEGTLTLMVGGADEDFERCRPMLEAVGRKVIHLGRRPGDGEVGKLCNNVISNCTLFAALEAIRLAEAYGVEEEAMLNATRAGTGNAWFIENWSFVDHLLKNHTLAGTDAIYYLLTKDVWDAVESARSQGVDMVVAGAASLTGRRLLAERDRDLRQLKT